MATFEAVRWPSVRAAFAAELRAIAPRGTCLLPEWMCDAMIGAAHEVGWQPRFYRVRAPADSLVPLEADLDQLAAKLRPLPPPVVVVLAEPMGYADARLERWLASELPAISAHATVVLDLAQSYGRVDPRPTLTRVRAAYVSFNGNKLIGSGGALRLAFVSGSCESPAADALFAEFAAAGEAQLARFEATLAELGRRRGASALAAVRAAIWPAPAGARANALRTVVARERLGAALLRGLAAGFGQPLAPDIPDVSAAYRRWQADYFLLFPERREPSPRDLSDEHPHA